MKKYIDYGMVAITSVKLAEIARFIPDPETLTKSILVAFLSAFVGAFAKWLFDKAVGVKK